MTDLTATIATLVNLLASSFTVVDQLTNDLRRANTLLNDQHNESKLAADAFTTRIAQLERDLDHVKTNYDIVVQANAAIRTANDELTDQLAAIKGEIDTPY